MPYDYIEEYQKQNDETIWKFRDKDAQAKIDTSLTETDYANPLSLETMQAQVAKNTKIKLDPIQDLHGYDKPWVGGAGKNKLLLTVDGIKAANTSGTWSGNAYTLSQVTFTILTDSDNNVIGINVNGTPNGGNVNFRLNQVYDIPQGNYILSDGMSQHSNNFNLTTFKNDSWVAATNRSDNVAFTVDSDGDIRQVIYVANGTSVNNVVVYPMIRLSDASAGFASYTNLCPITGRSEIDILGCGKNLLPNDIKWYRNNSGNFSYTNDDSTTRIRTTSFAITSGDYILSGVPSGSSLLSVRCYDINKNRLSDVYGTSNTFTLNDNVKYIHLLFGGTNYTSSTNTEFANANILLEKGNQPTDYEPYTISNDLTIDLPSTVYGGVLDLESGELVVDRKIEDFGNLNYGYDSANTRFFTNSISDIKYNATLPRVIQFYSSCYNCVHDGRAISQIVNGDAYIGAGSPSLYIHDYRYDGATLNDFKTAVTGQTLCYKLATPTTIQLTPSQLYLLKNQNNLTTSQYTQIKVTYRNGIFATLEPVSEDNDGLMSRLDKVKLNSISDDATKTESSTTNGNIKINGTETQVYDDSEIKGELTTDTTTIEGNPLNFTTLSAQTAKSTILSLEPIQDLHGYDKPWVGGAGKNLFDGVVELGTIGSNGENLSNDNRCRSKNHIAVLPNTTYIFSVNGTATNVNWVLYDNTKTKIDGGGGGTGFTTPNNCYYVRWFYDLTLYQQTNYQLEVGSSPTSFEPYENICPISGRTEIGILGCGENLWDRQWEVGVFNQTTGLPESGTSNAYRTKNKIAIESNKSYIFKSNVAGRFFFYSGIEDIASNYISNTVVNQDTAFTTPQNAHYMNFQASDTIDVSNVTINRQSTDLTIDLGRTVYGGTLDVENGVLVVDREMKVYDGTNYTPTDHSTGNIYMSIENTAKYKASNEDLCMSCNCAKWVANDITTRGSYCYNGSQGAYFTKNSIFASASDFTAYALNNNIQMVIPLRTPITIQLTPNEISLLEGVNNISTTADGITLTYRDGSVATLGDLTSAVDNLDSKIDESKILTDTATGDKYILVVTNGVLGVQQISN